MGVRRVGVEIVAEGVQQAIQQANQFSTSVTGIGDAAKVAANNTVPLTIATDSVTQALNRLQQTSSTTSDTIQQIGSQSATSANQVNRIGDAVNEAGQQLNTFKIAGIPVVLTLGDIKNAAQAAIQPFVNLGRQAFGAVSSYQQLAMSMESLVAKEIRAADSTIEMTDALEQAKPRAAELLSWIQQLAINSPFDQAGVAQAFRTAQAYGFTAAEAQRLTKATIDFASATGQGSFEMQRISLALGQIKAKGKVAQQELNQLTQTGIAIAPVFERMGISMGDVAKGTVGAGEFIKAFTEMLESDFAGAAARTTNTLDGLTSTLGDLRIVTLRSLTMPFFEAITPVLSQAIGSFNKFMPTIEFVGQQIGRFTTFLLENKTAILSVVATITAGVGAFLLISNYSLIAGAAFKGLVAVLMGGVSAFGAISTAITFLLSPLGIVSVVVATLAALFAVSFTTMQDKVESLAIASSKTASLVDMSFGTLSQTAVSTASMFSTSTRIMDGSFRDVTQGIEASSKKMEESVTAHFTQMGIQTSDTVQKTSTKIVADWGERGDKIAQIAAQQSEESHSWGYNLVMQFANGMAQAANAVIDVLISIGEQIAYWLAPGSPPRITPEIDKWGELAMSEFVNGFTKADFSTLKNLSGTIKSYLGSLGEDTLDQKDLIPTLIGSREAIAEAIAQIRETGSVGSDSIQKIIDSIGVASPELESYITSLLNVEQTNQAVKAASEAYAAAQDKVKQSQEALNAVSEKYNAILAPMNEELAAIAEKREQFQTSQRVSVLQSILADKNAPAIAKELALMELREIQLKQQIKDAQKAQQAEEEAAQQAIDSATEEANAAQENLNTAVEAAEQAQNQIDLQKEILGLQIETNNMYKDQAALLEKLNKDTEDALDGVGDSAKGAAGKIGQLGEAIGGLADGIKPIGSAVGGMFDGIKQKLDGFLEDVTAPFQGLQDKATTLKQVWAGVFIDIGNKIQGVWNIYLKPIFGEWNISLSDVGSWLLKAAGAWLLFKATLSIYTTLDTAVLAITKLGTGLFTLTGYLWSAIKAVGVFVAGLGAGILVPLALIGVVVGGLIYHFGGLTQTIDAFSAQFATNGTFGSQGPMVQALNAISKYIEDWVSTTSESFTGWSNQVVASIALWMITTSEQITTWITEKEAQFVVWATNVAARIALWSTTTLATFNRWITDSLAKISVWIMSFGIKIASFAVDTIAKFTQFWDDAKALFDEKVALLLVTITNWKDDILEKVASLKDGFVEKVTNMWTDIKAGFDTSISSLLVKVTNLIADVAEIFVTTDWSSLGLGIITGIVNGIVNSASLLYTAIKDLISDAIADALAGIGGGNTGGGATPQGGASGFANTPAGTSNTRGFVSSSTPNAISLPSTIAPPVTYNRTVTNHNQYTGIGQADVNNGMDVQHLQAIIEMTMMRMMQNQGYGA